MSRLLAIIAWVGLLLSGATVGCRLPARTCVPPQVAMSYLRDADAPDGQFPMANPDLLSSLQQTLEKQNSEGVVPNRPPQNYLALTGGGVFGSFTVGVLCGWTDSGKRPQFDVVTGISTGALIATYAFLGPKYDSVLRDYYSNYGSREVYRPRRKLSILWSDSVVDNTPLRQKIDAACTPELLAEVAEAHRAGRRLYIGTTNLDTRQLVIWDMGAIAASGRPEARTLYRDVILASCSVPAFFPPVRIEVEINGQRYEELHVDGGATTAVFFQPFMLQLDRGNIRSRAGSNLYVINAGKIFADPDCVKPRIIKIASTTLRTMLYAGSRNDLFRLYTLALITGVNYHLAAVPQDFPMDLDALKIDPKQMRRLYEEGYRQGRTGEAWHTRLDNIGLHDDIMPRSGNRLQAWPSANTSR